MDIVFFESVSDISHARQLFPKNKFLIAGRVRTDADFLRLKSLCDKTGLPGCVVLDQLDSKWVSKIRQANLSVGVWPLSAAALNAAVSSKQTDFLFQVAKPEKPVFDLQLFSVAALHKTVFVFVFEPYLNAQKSVAVELFKSTIFAFLLAQKTKARALFVSGSTKMDSLRSQADLQIVSKWFESMAMPSN